MAVRENGKGLSCGGFTDKNGRIIESYAGKVGEVTIRGEMRLLLEKWDMVCYNLACYCRKSMEGSKYTIFVKGW